MLSFRFTKLRSVGPEQLLTREFINAITGHDICFWSILQIQAFQWFLLVVTEVQVGIVLQAVRVSIWIFQTFRNVSEKSLFKDAAEQFCRKESSPEM